MGAENPTPSGDSHVQELIEIYGECTTFISANDVENLREQLPPEDFAQISTALGLEEVPVTEERVSDDAA